MRTENNYRTASGSSSVGTQTCPVGVPGAAIFCHAILLVFRRESARARATAKLGLMLILGRPDREAPGRTVPGGKPRRLSGAFSFYCYGR